MTVPTHSPVEARLRAHFQDLTARVTLPGAEADQAVRRAVDGEAVPVTISLTRRRNHRRWVVLSGVAAAVLLVVGVFALVRDDRDDTTRIGTDTDEPSPAPTAPSTVPPPTPSTGSPPTSGPPTDTPRPPAAGASSPAGPVVWRGGVLGWWDGSAWVRTAPGVDPPDDAGGYQILRLDEPISRGTSSPGMPCMDEAGGIEGPVVDLGPSPEGFGPDRIAVAGVADPLPRPVEVLDPTDPTYMASVAEAVRDLGIDDPTPEIAQVVRGDLDGDGVAEVLIAAQRLTDPNSLAATDGDYSVLFLRRVIGGQVATVPVASSVAVAVENQTPYLAVQRLSALADLNGDGRMEAVVDAQYYEGSTMAAFELQDGRLVEVLSGHCGV
jgi:hypothetical protein